MKNITGIILAGGKSSRMGSDKGLMSVCGKPMISHVIEQLEALQIPIIIIANNPAYSQFNYPVFEDLMKDKGPVGGIYTGLFKSSTEKNLIVSCDVPNVDSKLFEHLISFSENHVVTISEYEGKRHPLVGVYRKKALDVFKENLHKNQLKLSYICEDLFCKVLDFSKHKNLENKPYFSNINTPEEIKNVNHENES